MSFSDTLMRWAEETVAKAVASLPEELRAHAWDVPVVFAQFQETAEEGDEPLLGLFTGNALDDGNDATDPTQIILFIDALWDEAGHSPAAFVEEVRITYLHELGHYFGWDEEEIARRGLA